MRQYLHKTGLLLTIFIMVSVIFNLCGAAIKHQKEPEKLLPNLSNEYALVESKKSMKLETYITKFEKVKEKFLLGVVLDGDLRAVYAEDSMWKGLKLVSGHLFMQAFLHILFRASCFSFSVMSCSRCPSGSVNGSFN